MNERFWINIDNVYWKKKKLFMFLSKLFDNVFNFEKLYKFS